MPMRGKPNASTARRDTMRTLPKPRRDKALTTQHNINTSYQCMRPYKGAAPALADLLGNQIQVGMTSKAVLLPLIKAGKLRALAVTSETRWPELPDVPTLHESNFEGIPSYLYSGLLAPARTPPAVVEKINAALNEGLKTSAVKASIAKLGLESRLLTPQQFNEVLAGEARLWEAAVQESKVKLE